MNDRRPTQITSRKKPRQARSNELVAAILEAALQVLAREGAQRFTTTRVAERAGVSVGSIYQYFPNKAAILFRLQGDEWRETTDMLRAALAEPERPPLERLRRLVHAFVKSECDEAALRVALGDAAPLYRDAPEAKAMRASSKGILQAFMREVLPDAKPAARTLAGKLIKSTLSTVGKEFSETPRTPREIAAWSDAMADMLAAYLVSLGHVAPAPARERARARRAAT
ncbi:MAG: TetR family transcriptional regulator [Burkholderiales bacterium]|nr:TetR family transcriptional regulator [Burkholderiales bacterium]